MAMTSVDSLKNGDVEDDESWPVEVPSGYDTATAESDGKATATAPSPEAILEAVLSVEPSVGERASASLETTDIGACFGCNVYGYTMLDPDHSR